MKHYILAFAEPPAGTETADATRRIYTFSELAKEIQLPAGIRSVLPKGAVWLFERGTGERLLADLFALADRCAMELRVKYLSED